jgi:LysR family hydrogen peroxide-inducible transcriptional activator
MNLNNLHCFCTLIETRNFHNTASILHKTQPAVSQQIRKLENEMGTQLVDRSDNSPTPAGRLVYQKGKELLLTAENLSEEIKDFNEIDRSILKVGTSDTNALYFLPERIRRFRDDQPLVTLEIVSTSTDAIAQEVVQGQLDLGIITLPIDDPGLSVRQLFTQKLQLIVPKDHPLKNKRKIRLDLLKDEPFILLAPSTRTGNELDAFFNHHDFKPTTTMTSGSFEVIKRYVKEGVGIAIVPSETLTDQDRSELSNIHLSGLPSIGIGVIWRKGQYLTKAAQVLTEILTDNDQS